MSGPVSESWVDTVALARAVTVSGQIEDDLAVSSASLRDLDARVRAGCGSRSAPGGGLDELQWLRARMAQTDRFADEVRRDVLVADGTQPPSLPPSSPSPWLDAETDSWVVGLGRQLSGRPSVPLITRMVEGAPSLRETLTGGEFTTPTQTGLLLNNPEAFFDNWQRAGGGALDAGVGMLTTFAGGAAMIVPGIDDLAESIVGRRPGDLFRAAVLGGLHQAARDPDGLVEATLGVAEYQADPYRWFGSMLPDLAAEAISTALPISTTRVIRRLPPPGEPPAVPLVIQPPATRRRGTGSPVVAGSEMRPDRTFPDLEAFRRAEGDWAPSDAIVSHREGAFESPEGWVADLNGDGPDAPGRNNNCIDCARATEANWRGQDAMAASLRDPDLPGVPVDRLEDWSGGRMVPATLDEVAEQLTELGPGSSAMIASAWDTGGAHAFNAVNDGGIIKWVDAQSGQTTLWPPPYADAVEVSLVIWIDADGRPR